MIQTDIYKVGAEYKVSVWRVGNFYFSTLADAMAFRDAVAKARVARLKIAQRVESDEVAQRLGFDRYEYALINLWKAGKTAIEIGKLFGKNKVTIRNHAKAIGLPARPVGGANFKGNIDKRNDIARKLGYDSLFGALHSLYIKKGLSMKKIAKIFGASKSAIYADIRRFGLQRKPKLKQGCYDKPPAPQTEDTN